MSGNSRLHKSAALPWIIFGVLALVLLVGGVILVVNQLAPEFGAVIQGEF